MSYSKPKCLKNSKLIKSRCECKKETKKKIKKDTKKKTSKNKTLRKTKNDKYEEKWALVPGQYSINKPSVIQLKARRKRIDEVYKLHDKIKKLDKGVLPIKDWQYPPEFCYNEQLKNMIKDMKRELKYLKKLELTLKSAI